MLNWIFCLILQAPPIWFCPRVHVLPPPIPRLWVDARACGAARGPLHLPRMRCAAGGLECAGCPSCGSRPARGGPPAPSWLRGCGAGGQTGLSQLPAGQIAVSIHMFFIRNFRFCRLLYAENKRFMLMPNQLIITFRWLPLAKPSHPFPP